MKYNRSKNTKRNIIVGEIDKISGILLPFFVRTMILHWIGAEYLGLTGLFYSILQMLNLMEMGFGASVIFSLYQPLAEHDMDTVSSLLGFYKRVYRLVGVAVLLLGLLIMPFLPHLIRGSVPEDVNLYALYLIYLLNSCIGFFVYPNRKALLTAYQREDIGGRIHIFTQLLMYAAQAVGIWFYRNYYLYALMMPAASLAYSLLCARKVGQVFPISDRGKPLDPMLYQRIRKQIAGLMIRKLAQLSRNAFDSMFLSSFLGLNAVAVYSNYYYICDAAIMVLAVVKTSMAGGVGNSIATESADKNRSDMQRINFLFMWISGWCSICLLCLYQPFMEVWVGADMMLPFSSAILFSVYFYILKTSDIRTLYAESAGIWWQARYISIAEAATNLVLNWLLIRIWGMNGVILASMLSYLIFNFFCGAVVLFQTYFTMEGLKPFLVAHAGYAAGTAINACLSYGMISLISREADGITALALRVLGCAVLPHVIYLVIYYHTKDFKSSCSLIAARWKTGL